MSYQPVEYQEKTELDSRLLEIVENQESSKILQRYEKEKKT